MNTPTCKHWHFESHVTINRLEDTATFAADVTIRCIDCGVPFQFLGLPGGLIMGGAAVSVDRTEARLSIAPLVPMMGQIEEKVQGK